MKYLLKIAAWNIGLVIPGILIVELVFGGWFGAPQLWSLSIVRDINWQFNVPGTYRRDTLVHYTRDKWGLRGDFGSPSNVEIVAIGGSTTDEGRVSNKETWPEVLEQCLKANAVEADIANAGIGGQSSLGHILNFHKWFKFIPQFKPKVALVYLGYNEHQGAALDLQQDPKNYKGIAANSNKDVFIKWAKINSAIYNVFQIIRGNVVAWKADLGPVRRVKSFISSEKKKEFSIDIRDKIYRDESYVEIGSEEYKKARLKMLGSYGAKIEAYRQRLAELDRAAAEFGAVPVYVTQNAWGYWRVDNRIYGQLSGYHLFNAINDVTRTFCRSAGRFCIDVAGSYYFGKGDVYDQIHTTPQGSHKIAMEICAPLSQWIKTSKLLK